MSLDEHDPGLVGLEAALAALAPMPGRIDRDALLFRAGQLSLRRGRWAWPGVAAALGVVALTLGVVLALRPTPTTVERVVYIRIKEPSPPAPQVREPDVPPPEPKSIAPVATAARQAPMNYLELERQVFRWDMDGMPATLEALSPSGPPLTRDRPFSAPAAPPTFAIFFDLRSLVQ